MDIHANRSRQIFIHIRIRRDKFAIDGFSGNLSFTGLSDWHYKLAICTNDSVVWTLSAIVNNNTDRFINWPTVRSTEVGYFHPILKWINKQLIFSFLVWLNFIPFVTSLSKTIDRESELTYIPLNRDWKVVKNVARAWRWNKTMCLHL